MPDKGARMKKKSPEYYELDLQLAQAQDRIKELQAANDEKRMHIMALKLVAQRQRDSQELWLTPMSAFGHEIQQALRELHNCILDEKK